MKIGSPLQDRRSFTIIMFRKIKALPPKRRDFPKRCSKRAIFLVALFLGKGVTKKRICYSFPDKKGWTHYRSGRVSRFQNDSIFFKGALFRFSWGASLEFGAPLGKEAVFSSAKTTLFSFRNGSPKKNAWHQRAELCTTKSFKWPS